MGKILSVFFLIPMLLSYTVYIDDEAIKKEIHNNLLKSAEYWNKGDVEAYMSISYPKKDDILMQSANSRIYGYKKIYDMYAGLFPKEEARGVLTFSDVEVNVLSPDTAVEIGRFKLTYKDGKERSSYFTAILKKFPEGWRIVHDHS